MRGLGPRIRVRLVQRFLKRDGRDKPGHDAKQAQLRNTGSAVEIVLQHIMNGLMLGVMYALVAVGFTLYFGVLDIIKFSHGDVLTVGVFTGFATYLGLKAAHVASPLLQLVTLTVVAMAAMAALGAFIARALVLPLRSAPALNTLLLTLMLGALLREGVRLVFPDGSNPK